MDDLWASLNAETTVKLTSSRVTSALSAGTAASSARAQASRVTLLPALVSARGASSLDDFLVDKSCPAPPRAPTEAASQSLTRAAALARAPRAEALPRVADAIAAGGVAGAARVFARDISALSDGELSARVEASARLCTSVCGSPWTRLGGAADAGDEIDVSDDAGAMRITSRVASDSASTLHGLRGAVPAAPLSVDIAFGFHAGQVSDVAALLLATPREGGTRVAAAEEACGAAAAGCEVSETTRAIAHMLAAQHPDLCVNDTVDVATRGVPLRARGFAPDSDDEGDGAKPSDEHSGDAAEIAGDLSQRTKMDVSAGIPASEFAEFWGAHLMQAVLRRLDDQSEAVRVCALRLTATALASLRDVTGTLPLLLPHLLERINAADWVFDAESKLFARGSDALAAHKRGRVLPGFGSAQSVLKSPSVQGSSGETSEAVRASVVALLSALLRGAALHGAGAALVPWAGHIIVMSHALLVDTAPPVRCAAAVLVLQLCTLLPAVTKHFAVALIRGALPSLRARTAAVRVTALDAVDALVHCPDEAKMRGAGSEAIMTLLGGRDAHVIPVAAFYEGDVQTNYAAALAADGSGAVRARWTRALGGWATRLPDRHEWWPYVMPYLLSCLSDDDGSGDAGALPPARAALLYLDACGAAHEVEHAKTLLDRVQFGLDGDPGLELDGPLPPPFESRPRLGARLFVRAQSRRVFPPLLRELRDWEPFGGRVAGSDGARARAAALLCALLVFHEDSATGVVDDLASALASGVEEGIEATTGAGRGSVVGDVAVAAQMRAAARLVGRFLPPSAWVPQLAALARASVGASTRPGSRGLPSADEQSGALATLALALGEVALRPQRADRAALEALVAALRDESTWPIFFASAAAASFLSAVPARVLESFLLGEGEIATVEESPFIGSAGANLGTDASASAVASASAALAKLRLATSAAASAVADSARPTRSRRYALTCILFIGRIARSRAGIADAVGPPLIDFALALHGAILLDQRSQNARNVRPILDEASVATAVLCGAWSGAAARKDVCAVSSFSHAPLCALSSAALLSVATALVTPRASAGGPLRDEDLLPTALLAVLVVAPNMLNSQPRVHGVIPRAVALADALAQAARSGDSACTAAARIAAPTVIAHITAAARALEADSAAFKTLLSCALLPALSSADILSAELSCASAIESAVECARGAVVLREAGAGKAESAAWRSAARGLSASTADLAVAYARAAADVLRRAIAAATAIPLDGPLTACFAASAAAAVATRGLFSPDVARCVDSSLCVADVVVDLVRAAQALGGAAGANLDDEPKDAEGMILPSPNDMHARAYGELLDAALVVSASDPDAAVAGLPQALTGAAAASVRAHCELLHALGKR